MDNEIMITENDIAQVECEREDESGNYFFNTLGMDSMQGKIDTINVMNMAVSLNDYVGVQLKVRDAVTVPGSRASRQKGVPNTPCQNTYLIDTEGNAYFSQSDGVARSINMMHSVLKSFSDNELGYLPLICVEEKLANGNTLKKLVIGEM